MRQVVCPRCGIRFACKHDKECFCTKYTIPENVAEDMKRLYSDCLCEACINDLIKNSSK